jgi:hypothetical protein
VEKHMSIEVMKQALEALKLLSRYENPSTKWQIRKPLSGGPIVTIYPHQIAADAAEALGQAIEQAEQAQPVAWMWKDGTITADPDRADGTWTPLYTAPPQRKPLTDEEISKIASTPCAVVGSYVHTFARAIEAAHGIKEKK